MRTLFFVFLLFSSIASNAQNWKTVRNSDTTFFLGGVINLNTNQLRDIREDSSMLRVMYIQGTTALTTGDSVFSFYTTVRDTESYYLTSSCLDTLAPSWLGYGYQRTQAGTEYYRNHWGDTIIINTQASLGASWIMAKDTTGLLFRGTVSQTATQLIDGVTDSIKTISLQAMSGNVPVNNWYNGLHFTLSKNHGWLSVPDLYSFPGHIRLYWGMGTLADSMQYNKLPASLGNTNLTQDSVAIFTPGNEWIYWQEHGLLPYPIGPVIVNHDSVISETVVSPGIYRAIFKRTTFELSWTYVSGPPYSYNQPNTSFSQPFLDTVMFKTGQSYNTPQYLKRVFLPEVKLPTTHLVNTSGLPDPWRYAMGAKNFCGDRYLIDRSILMVGKGIILNNGCADLKSNIDGYVFGEEVFLPGFGDVKSYGESGDVVGQPTLYGYRHYSYLKLSNCIYGTKTDIAQLDVLSTKLAAPVVSLYPNPANERTTIVAAFTGKPVMYVYDIADRFITTQQLNNGTTEINTANWTTGTYIIKIVHQKGSSVTRLTVNH